MSGVSSRDTSSHHAAVRDAVASFVQAHGKKLGLHLAAEAIGISERVARRAYDGEPFAADQDRAIRADAARIVLLETEINRLQREFAEVTTRGLNVGGGMARFLARARAVLAGARGAAEGAGGAGARTGAMVVTP